MWRTTARALRLLGRSAGLLILGAAAASAQQGPIVVDVGPAQPAARDISVDVVLGMFAMAGALLALAALGGVLVAGAVVLYKRHRDATDAPVGPTHTQLKL